MIAGRAELRHAWLALVALTALLGCEDLGDVGTSGAMNAGTSASPRAGASGGAAGGTSSGEAGVSAADGGELDEGECQEPEDDGLCASCDPVDPQCGEDPDVLCLESARGFLCRECVRDSDCFDEERCEQGSCEDSP